MHSFMHYNEREERLLAPYALRSKHSRGREFDEAEHAYRSPFQRDRDRIIHSSAFRRLADKTQVFMNVSDYHRTRLTHTIEVVTIARTIGRTLGLNEELIEALGHLHDIGHPPFGHSGEDVLKECMVDCGGFSHNAFGLVLVKNLEVRSPYYEGLNLSYEVLEGQHTRVDKRQMTFLRPLLEAQTVETVDSIAYDAHDTDDAWKLGLVSFEELMQIPLFAQSTERVYQRFGELSGRRLRKLVVRQLIDFQVTDVLETAMERLAKWSPGSPEEAEMCEPIITVSDDLRARKTQLEQFLFHRVYRHPKIVEFRQRGQDQLRRMYDGYLRRPELIRGKLSEWLDVWGLPRTVGYYIATMTDSYCQREFDAHFR
ncbi:dNTP triphosphohydrolase [Bremerella cremea]|uniref:Deoxyguanosinetriphosphate triphosphohydrolase-like protein n=1 Tax=Blastopirellula marina TaxID=124 RepID=A0A2S8FKB5_9BACT|nr:MULTISPECIES: dNTP triphosphohydrolase [Pirellulaceae]PQO32606.1 metal-dependent phosphohydrolase [Blastopirellula marina]RCS45673.1 dNTP triphosphohydrolase [Bremerella cremea]